MAPRDITSSRPREVRDDRTRLRILELLLDGKTEDQTAGIVDLPRHQVTMVASINGWPHRGRTEAACVRFRQHLDGIDVQPTSGGPIPGFAGSRTNDVLHAYDSRGRHLGTLGEPQPLAFVSTDEDLELPEDDEDSPAVPRSETPATMAPPSEFRAAMVRATSVSVHPRNLGRDLGDLRDLAASIKRDGIRVPIAVETHAAGYRLRDGERRLAAAKLAGVKMLPALIHRQALSDRDWLLSSTDYNTKRQGYGPEDYRRVASQLEALGVDRRSIADALNVSTTKLREILTGPKTPPPVPKEARPKAVVSRRKVLDVVMRYREDLLKRRDIDRSGNDLAQKFFDELEDALS